jgi:aminotransferase
MPNLLEKAGIKSRTKGISKKFQDLEISVIKQIPILAKNMTDVISLAWGIPSFETPLHIRQAAAEGILNEKKLSYYSPSYGLPELQKAAGARLEKDYGIKINHENEIIITSGAMPALAGSLMTILDPGDEVLICTPSFPSYTMHVKFADGIPVYVPLDAEDNFRLDPSQVEKRITPKTKAIILCNPNNPTGTVQSEATLRRIGELSLQHDFWIITDDPYIYCCYDDREYFSLATVPELKDNLITIRSLSKEYAFPGWRISILYAEAGYLREFLKYYDSVIISAPTISQWGAIQALTGDQSNVTDHKLELDHRRHLMHERIQKMPTLLSAQLSEGTYYTFAKIEANIDDVDLALRLLNEAKVQVVPGSGFGPTGAGYIRLCFGYTQEDINEAFDRIEKWWSKQEYTLRS